MISDDDLRELHAATNPQPQGPYNELRADPDYQAATQLERNFLENVLGEVSGDETLDKRSFQALFVSRFKEEAHEGYLRHPRVQTLFRRYYPAFAAKVGLRKNPADPTVADECACECEDCTDDGCEPCKDCSACTCCCCLCAIPTGESEEETEEEESEEGTCECPCKDCDKDGCADCADCDLCTCCCCQCEGE
jgi:hypothetical protein